MWCIASGFGHSGHGLTALAQQVDGNGEHQAVLHVVRVLLEGHASRFHLREQEGEQRTVQVVELQPEQAGGKFARFRYQKVDLGV